MTSAIAWKTLTLPDAYVGVAYEAGLATDGAAAALTGMSATTGTLPDGLVVNADHVRITGTPTTPGTSTFKLTPVEAAGTGAVSGSLTITVRAIGEELAPRHITEQPALAQFQSMWAS